MMEHEQSSDEYREMVEQYHRPPTPPREEMWARIDAARRRDYGARRPPRLSVPRPFWGIGIAAMLVIGFAIGRFSIPTTSPVAPPLAVDAAVDPESDLPYRVAAAEHMSRAEVFLTSFQVVRRSGASDPRVSEWARDLLLGTHLLMDSPAADDPRTRQLLEDLELVLVQIAQLDGRDRPDELDLVDQALESHDMLPRLRTAIPAGPIPAGT